MPERETRAPRLPPRWFVRLFWSVHRGLYRVTAGRIGLWRPKGNRWGAMRLTATGRRRSVIVGHFEDVPNLVTMAMNGWGDGEPAWWLNLQAHPDAEVRLADGPRLVPAHAAAGDAIALRSPGKTSHAAALTQKGMLINTTAADDPAPPRVGALVIGVPPREAPVAASTTR